MKHFYLKSVFILLLISWLPSLASAQFFTEDFENGGTFPLGWTLTNGVDDWQIGDGTSYGPGSAHGGAYCAYFDDYNYSSGTIADMVSPSFDLTLAVNPEIHFWYFDGDGSDNVQVLISTDGITYTQIYTTASTVAAWTEVVIPIYSYAGQTTVSVAFRGNSIYGSSNPTIDDISVLNGPTCPDVSGITLNSFTATSAEIGWNSGNTESAWNVEYGTTGYTQGMGTLISPAPADTFAIATGLTANTSYDFYVQADCGGGDLSTWFGPFTVFTGYCNFTSTDPNYYIDNFSTTGCATNITNNGSGYSTNGYADSTQLAVSQYEGATVNFTSSFGSSTFSSFGFNIWVDWNNDLIFDSSEKMYASGAYVTSVSGSFDVPVSTPLGDYRMRIVADYDATDPNPCSNEYGEAEAEDYTFTVIPAPSCLPVNGIVASTVTLDGATINWNAGGTETAWNIEYGPTGFVLGTGMTANETDTFTVLTGLTQDTNYDVYVQADCGADSSIWAGPITFYTGYCTITGSDPSRYIDNFSTTGGVGNISNLASGFSTGGYEDATAMVVSQFDGGSPINFNADFVGGTFGFGLWVDWNNNLTFEPSEKMYNSGAYINPASGSFSVPSGTPVGTYRMRIVAHWLNTNPGACGDLTTYGEGEDYTFEVLPTPTCLPVSNITTNQLFADSVIISWTAGGTETSWNVEYGIPGFTPGTGSEIGSDVTVADSFAIGGLIDNTDYEFYVQADCSGGDLSYWTGPYTVTTLCNAIPAMGFCESFEDDSESLACWTVLDENGDNDAWGIYTNNPNTGANSAGMYTDYNNGANNDYLITPKLTLTGNEIMSFFYAVNSSFEPNDFEVLLSTTGTNPADFTTTLMALNSYSNTEYADTALNLSAFTGDVYIAFHIPSGGLDGWYLYIDDVCFDICTPAPGTNGTSDVCRLDNTIDLNTVITQGETNGVWSFPPNEGALSGSVADVTGIADGTFDMYYIVTTACTVDTTIATINIHPASSAGMDGQIDACKNQPLNLLSGLSGLVDVGGTWYNPSNTALADGQIDTGNLPGQFNYNYVVSNGFCPNDTSNVILNISSTCDWTGIEELNGDALTVHPNPSSGLFYISNTDAGQIFNYEVVDLNGSVLLKNNEQINGSSTIEVNLSTVENGIYLIRLFNSYGSKLVRVVKQ